jgi:hypothetical protein
MVRTARVSAGALLPTGRRVILRNYLLRGHRHGSSLEAELWTGFFSFSSFLPSGWCGPTTREPVRLISGPSSNSSAT